MKEFILDPDADGSQWLYKGYIIIEQDHPKLLKYAIYKGEEFIDVAVTKSECKRVVDGVAGVAQHGGSRPGSGRKKGEETQTVSFRLKLNQIAPVKELVRTYLKYHFKG